MSEKIKIDGVIFPSSEDRQTDQNLLKGSKNPINYYSIPPISDDQLSLWLHNAPNFASNICTEDHAHNHLPSFEIPASSQLQSSQKSKPRENPCLHNAILHGSDRSQSTTGHRKYSHEAGVKEDFELKQQGRTRSTKAHNRNERLRRQNLTEKMKALQEMIPNSTKRDQASTIEDAINYIKTLQHQLQTEIEDLICPMISRQAGYSMFHSPVTTMLQQGQQGMQLQCPAPFLQTGMKHEIEIRIPGMFSSFTFPSIGQFGLPSPCFLPSSSAAAAHSIQNPRYFLEPPYATSIPSSGSQSNKQDTKTPKP